MTWCDLRIKSGIVGIDLVTQKTRRPMWIPLDPDFAADLETWRPSPEDHGFILRKRNGDSFSRSQVTDLWTRERRKNPRLAPLAGRVLHGLRATAIVRLQQVGATTRQIAELIGMSERMVERYTRNSEQEDNALAAMALLIEHRRNKRGESL
jgi:integrase